jgi:hypothetical protein
MEKVARLARVRLRKVARSPWVLPAPAKQQIRQMPVLSRQQQALFLKPVFLVGAQVALHLRPWLEDWSPLLVKLLLLVAIPEMGSVLQHRQSLAKSQLRGMAGVWQP